LTDRSVGGSIVTFSSDWLALMIRRLEKFQSIHNLFNSHGNEILMCRLTTGAWHTSLSKLAITILFLNSASFAKAAQLENKNTEIKSAVGVTTSDIQSLVFYPKRNAPAKVEVLNQSKIPARISAVLNSLLVRVGDSFNAGDVLAILDCRESDFGVVSNESLQKQLKANYDFETRQLIRGKKLAKQNTIGEAELDRLRTTVALADAQLAAQESSLKRALLNQKYCSITAPYRGIVTRRLASEGEMLAVGSPVLESIELDNTEISASIPLNDAKSFESAKNYQFESNGEAYALNKRTLLPVVLNQSRSREARLHFSEQQATAGATGRLFWSSPIQHLPANLLQERNGQRGIFVVNGDKAKFVAIEGAQEGRPILLEDFSFWQQQIIILDGRHGLINGQQVLIHGDKQ